MSIEFDDYMEGIYTQEQLERMMPLMVDQFKQGLRQRARLRKLPKDDKTCSCGGGLLVREDGDCFRAECLSCGAGVYQRRTIIIDDPSDAQYHCCHQPLTDFAYSPAKQVMEATCPHCTKVYRYDMPVNTGRVAAL